MVASTQASIRYLLIDDNPIALTISSDVQLDDVALDAGFSQGLLPPTEVIG